MLADLYHRHARELRAYCAGLVGPDLVDDATGDLWLRAVRTWPAYQERGEGRAWLYTLARSACYDLLRRERRRHTLRLDTRHAAELPDVDSRVDAHHAAARLLARLTDKQRQVLWLCADGWAGADAARELGVTLMTYKARLHRARMEAMR